MVERPEGITLHDIQWIQVIFDGRQKKKKKKKNTAEQAAATSINHMKEENH